MDKSLDEPQESNDTHADLATHCLQGQAMTSHLTYPCVSYLDPSASACSDSAITQGSHL